MTARTGQPKTGGRKKRSIDKAERQLISDGMAADLLGVYQALGGRKWLLEFAKANPKEFIAQGLSRLLPPHQKEADDGDGRNVQNNYFNNLTPLEAAQRVAFALSVGARELDKQAVTIEHQPAPAPVAKPVAKEPAPDEATVTFDPKAWVPPTDAPDMPDPGERDDPLFASRRERDRQHWAEEVHLTPAERADRSLVRELQESDITNYRGSAAEHSGGCVSRPDRKLSAGEKCRVISSRRNRNDLL